MVVTIEEWVGELGRNCSLLAASLAANTFYPPSRSLKMEAPCNHVVAWCPRGR